MIELMAPAGSFEALRAAIKAGADSIYFGVEELNMRSRSANFILDNLAEIAKICSDSGVKSYLTVNTVIYDTDMDLLKRILETAKKAKVTAIIACDIAVMKYARSIGLEVHSSTQLNISNIEAVKFYSQFTDVVVLARELNLEQVKYICDQIKEQQIKGPKGEFIQIEVFCHGAMCVSISGKCYMSLATYNFSANRGACLQPCRRKYRVFDDETGNELVIDNKYVMSPKDMCTISILNKLVSSGISVLKIEGRARAPEYVYTVVKTYKDALKSIEAKSFTKEKAEQWTKDLETVYNRGFWHGGYFMGKKLGEWCGVYGSKATIKKEYIGKVINYFDKKQVAHVQVESGELNKGDKLLFTGPTTGVVYTTADKIMQDKKELESASKTDITLAIPEKVRKNDKLFILTESGRT